MLIWYSSNRKLNAAAHNTDIKLESSECGQSSSAKGANVFTGFTLFFLCAQENTE